MSKGTVILLVVIGCILPGASPEKLIADVHGLGSSPKMVTLSIKPEMKAPALATGADAIVSKNAPPDELIVVIRSLKKSSVNSTN
jgi:DNA-binding NarL/FixJ family response regulator